MPRKSRYHSRRRRKQTVWTFVREQARAAINTLRQPFRSFRGASTPLVQPAQNLLAYVLAAIVDYIWLFFEVIVGLFWRAVTFVRNIYLTLTQPDSHRSNAITQRKRQVQKEPEEPVEPRHDEAEERRISLVVSDMIYNFIGNVLGDFPPEQAPSNQQRAHSEYATDSDDYRATTDSQDEDYLDDESEIGLDDNTPELTASEIDHRKFSQQSLKTWQSAPAVLASTSDVSTTGSEPNFEQSRSSDDINACSSDSEIKSKKPNISNKGPTKDNTHDKETTKPVKPTASEMSNLSAPKDQKSRSPSPTPKTPEISDDDAVRKKEKTEKKAEVLKTSDSPLIKEDKDLKISESPAKNEETVLETGDPPAKSEQKVLKTSDTSAKNEEKGVKKNISPVKGAAAGSKPASPEASSITTAAPPPKKPVVKKVKAQAPKAKDATSSDPSDSP